MLSRLALNSWVQLITLLLVSLLDGIKKCILPFLILLTYFLIMCLGYGFVYVCLLRPKKGVKSTELELQTAVSCLTQAQETKLKIPICALNQ